MFSLVSFTRERQFLGFIRRKCKSLRKSKSSVEGAFGRNDSMFHDRVISEDGWHLLTFLLSV